MAIRTREELLNSLNTRFAGDNSDEVLGLIEDVTDTITDLETRVAGDGIDWHQRYMENDNQWRQRYRDRFMLAAPPESEPPADDIPEPPKVKTFEELFETVSR